MIKKSISLITICLLLFTIGVYAIKPADLNPTGVNLNVAEIEKIGGIIVGAIQAIGVIVAVTVLIYLGIRFMLASPSEKANIKGMAIPYIVGALLIFATTSLVNILYTLAAGITV